jgi:ATP-dependent RNA helicase DDX3X
LQSEENVLFAHKGDPSERGVIEDNIPVERSGPLSTQGGVLDSFSDLEKQIPSYLTENIKLMKYDKPTPIQKHAIPLGLAGVDLMCCAQTVL